MLGCKGRAFDKQGVDMSGSRVETDCGAFYGDEWSARIQRGARTEAEEHPAHFKRMSKSVLLRQRGRRQEFNLTWGRL